MTEPSPESTSFGGRTQQVSSMVARARSLSSVEEAGRFYGEWASSYDDDVFAGLGFTGSARIAELLAGVLPDPHLPVVDLGCGTGAVGVRLAQLGVTIVDGIDLSPEMIALAERTGAYRALRVSDLNTLPTDPNARYAASVSAGTFTTGHVGPDVVPRVLELLRPEGFVAWVIAEAVWPSFEPVLASHRLRVLHRALEPIRRDGPPEAVMYVGQCSGPP